MTKKEACEKYGIGILVWGFSDLTGKYENPDDEADEDFIKSYIIDGGEQHDEG